MTARRTAWAVLVAALLALGWWCGVDGTSTDDADAGHREGSSQVDGQHGGPSPAEARDSSRAPAPSSVPSATARVDEHGLPWVALAALPPEAREVLADIDAGGPYDHPGKDGSTFGNYEGALPQQRRGYYREYTVETPGLGHRGARRLVTGSRGELYWTADHYATFERIRR